MMAEVGDNIKHGSTAKEGSILSGVERPRGAAGDARAQEKRGDGHTDVLGIEEALAKVSLVDKDSEAVVPEAERNAAGKTRIYFDLETTGLPRTSHITQIAAVRDKDTFMCFVMPQEPIGDIASKITGIKILNGVMYQHGKKVDALGIKEAITGFITFIRKTDNNHLIGHNIKSFDCPIIMNAAKACEMVDEFVDCVEGCVDTLKLFRLSHPKRSSYKQETLLRELMDVEYGAHDALEDVRALQRLVDHVGSDLFAEEFQTARFTLVT